MSSLGTSLLLAGLATILAVVIAFPFAVMTSRKDVPGNRIWLWVLLLPLCLPTCGYLGEAFSRLLAWLGQFSGAGRLQAEFLSLHKNLIFGAVELALVYFPLAALPVLGGLLYLDRRFEDSARLYRAAIPVFLRIKFPLLIAAVLSGAALVFIFSLYDHAVAHSYRLQTFSAELTASTGEIQDMSMAALGLIVFALAGAAVPMLLARQIGSTSLAPPFGGKAVAGNSEQRSVWALTGALFWAAVTVFAPAGLKIAAATSPAAPTPTSGLAQAQFPVLIALITMALWLFSANLPLEKCRRSALSPLKHAFMLYGGMLVFCALVMRFLLDAAPTVSVYAGVLSATVGCAAYFLAAYLGGENLWIRPELREAAQLYGSSGRRRFRRILLPLFGGRIAGCGLIAFLVGMVMFGSLAAVPAAISGTAAAAAQSGPLQHDPLSEAPARLAVIWINLGLWAVCGAIHIKGKASRSRWAAVFGKPLHCRFHRIIGFFGSTRP